MKKSEFIIAGILSLGLGLGIALGFGGSRTLLIGRDEQIIAKSPPVRTSDPPSTSVTETPATQVMPIFTEQGSDDISNGPSIEIWHGRTQNFGFLGNPQEKINILGNVFDPDGISSLTYSLNGGQEMGLCIGKKGLPGCNPSPRLQAQGDFNIEINNSDLSVGQNAVLIKALDELNNHSTELVTVQYSGTTTWPLPYTIDWSATTRISDVAQLVDGKWMLETDSIRPAEIGYDRLVAIGDISWDDYEVTVPITIHGNPYSSTSVVGILVRWPGHFTVGAEQPGTGWWRIGAFGFYSGRELESGKPYLALQTDHYETEKEYDVNLDPGGTYFFKMRVETKSPDQGGYYSFKVWNAEQHEPTSWIFQKQDEPPNQPLNGSILLVAHRLDASFGDVTILPLTPPPTFEEVNESEL